MKYNGTFDVDADFLVGKTIVWKITGNGELIIAAKDGRKYVIKRNIHIRYPSEVESKAVCEIYKSAADAQQKKQERLRVLMKGLNWEKDHIVVEEENFWDSENKFVTVTPYVSDALPDSYDYTDLSDDEFIELARSVSEDLDKLHDHGVIHGDLKEKNILVSDKSGKYIAYLIDFDSSYPVDEIPDRELIGGTNGYQSPEVILYGSSSEEYTKDAITTATDIFSLGLVLHKWWTGNFPEVDLERASVGVAVYLDKTVTINQKFNVIIGHNCKSTFQSLIGWMLAKNPSDRPTAKQVVDVLSDKLAVPAKYCEKNDAALTGNELWDAHLLVAELVPVSELRSKGVIYLKRINDGSESGDLKYRVITKGGTDRVMTIFELCDVGYAICKGAETEEPWEDHMIEFEPSDVIFQKGYARICKSSVAHDKLYLITTVNGREFSKGYEWLVAEGLAHFQSVTIESDTPWPEHGRAYCPRNMARLGVKSIFRMEVAGEHRYKIVYKQIVDGKHKVNERVPANNLKLMGFIK